MVRTSDGFEVAETDLELRGPGDMSGTQQSGLPQFKLANLVSDYEELRLAREAAKTLLKQDPHLHQDVHYFLKKQLEKISSTGLDWGMIS